MYRTKVNPLVLVCQPLELVDAEGNRTVRSINGEFSAEQMFAHGYYLDIEPSYDPATHKLGDVPIWNEQDGTVTMEVVEKTAEEIAAERAVQCAQIAAAGKSYIESQIDPDGLILVNNLAQAGHPYGQANFAWGVAVRKEQKRREAVIEAGVEDFSLALLDFSAFGDKPYTVEQMMLAAGM